MAKAPIVATSTSASHDVTVTHKLPPPVNRKICNKDKQIQTGGAGNIESCSEKTRGKRLKKQPIGANVNTIINETNPASEESVLENNNTEIETIQAVILKDVLIAAAAAAAVPVESGSSIKIEIVRSIVYGGLTELITSLGMVTSTSTTTATTGKLAAVSLASLIVGLFVMIYKISELWMKSEAEPRDEEVESYQNVLGDKRNYGLHLKVAILSFVVFGLVPPVVYGLSFSNPENKPLKISTVTIVTVFCASLLGVGKAYTKSPSTCAEYVYITGKCIIDAIGTSALTVAGGDLIANYIEKTGWFETNKTAILFQSAVSFENTTWGA